MMKNLLKTIFLLLLGVTFLSSSGLAAEKDTSERKTYFPEDYRDVDPNPKKGQAIQKYAEDAQEGAQKNFGVQAVHDNQLFATFNADRLEHQWKEHGVELFLWDLQAWLGEDYNKIYLESEGEMLLDNGNDIEEATVELLYSRNIGRFWDFRAGVRHDFEPEPERSFAVIGFLGLAPQWFEIDANAYLSDEGDVSAKIEVEYELMLTQRLVLVPRLESGISFQDVPEYEQWEGINDITLGARLMYQIRREFAPYIGVSWNRLLGETENRIEREGGDTESTAIVSGVKVWF